MAAGSICILLCFACESFEKASIVPEIHFKSLETISVSDTAVYELVFSFQDGDADFGSNNSSTNVFLVPYQKIDGNYEPVDETLYGLPYSIANDEKLTRSGQNKTIKGEIKIKMLLFPTLIPFDTLRYDFYIVDRAGHESNVESTTDIAL